MSERIQTYLRKLKTIPPRLWLLLGGLILILIYSLVFFIPKPVEFSYARETCVSQLVVAPGLHKVSSDTFEVTLKDELKIGSWSYASTRLCFTPKTALKAGSYTATLSPWGSIVAMKQFVIKVPDAPKIAANAFEGKKVSTVMPLQIPLGAADVVHEYSMKVADKVAECRQQEATLSCPVADLKLKQGAFYTLGLYRTIGDEQQNTEKLAEAKVETLDPLLQTASSLVEGQTIYDKAKTFTFSFDKPLKQAKIELKNAEGKEIALDAQIKTKEATVTLKEDLPRKAQFQLTLAQIIGEDGSTLETPTKITFTTSGGPKVSNVSVGSSKVPQSARIVLTFDQPMHESVDVTKLIRATGVSATVQKLSETQVAVTLQSAPLCTPFSIAVDKGIKSGSNDELSEEDWKFSSRIICGYAATIGYSVKGRPIVAHYFGSGSKTLLFTAAIHGSEPSSRSTVQALVDYLYANGDKIPTDKRIVIVPNANPDGIATGARYNANNVNLDRNFPAANWAADIDTASGIVKNGGGTAPLSEPESRALYNLTLQVRPRMAIAYHAQGSLVGANQVGDSTAVGANYARTVGYGTMFGNAEEVMGYSITGEYEEWMGEVGIPAILIELPRHSGNYFNSQWPAIQQLFKL